MATKTEKAIDITKIVGNLNKLAETPNPNASRTLKDIIADEPIWSAIMSARAQGYGFDVISETLKAGDLEISTGTLQSYVRQIMKDKGEDSGAKGNAKSKANTKKNATAKPSEAGAEKPSDAKPDTGANGAGTGTKPDAKPEGKNLTKQPNMGGAFSDNL